MKAHLKRLAVTSLATLLFPLAAQSATLTPMQTSGGFWVSSDGVNVGVLSVNCGQRKVGFMQNTQAGPKTTQIFFDTNSGQVTSMNSSIMTAGAKIGINGDLEIDATTNLNQLCEYGMPRAPERIVSDFLQRVAPNI